jgi:hypothetical protein
MEKERKEKKEGRRKEDRKEGGREGRKEGGKEGRVWKFQWEEGLLDSSIKYYC